MCKGTCKGLHSRIGCNVHRRRSPTLRSADIGESRYRRGGRWPQRNDSPRAQTNA